LTQALRLMDYEVDEGSIVGKLDGIKMSGFKVPTNLESSVRKYLKEHPDVRWDVALEEILAKSAPRNRKRRTK
jgi:hypothetical protein